MPDQNAIQKRKVLYNDAVQNHMFWAKTPSFNEFNRRLDKVPGYADIVYNNYAKHGVDLGARNDYKSKMGLAGYSINKPVMRQRESSMTPAERVAMIGNVQNMVDQANEGAERVKNRIRYAKANSGLQVKPVHLGQNQHVVQTEDQVDPESGKMGPHYITESGNEYDNRAGADLEQNQLDDKRSQLQRELDDAYAERDRLNDALSSRGDEIDKTQEGQMWRDMPRGAGGAIGTVNYNSGNGRLTDDKYRQLQTAADTNSERIRTLEAERDKGGFWRGFVDTNKDPNTWLLGIPSLLDTATLYQTAKKVQHGKSLTPEERGLLDDTIANQKSHDEYDNKRGFLYDAGQISAQSIPFVGEFLATGGMDDIAKVGSQLGAKAAAKYGTNAASKWIIKNTGVAAGDVAAGFALANTTGVARGATDVMQRNIGQPEKDSNGNYKMEGAKGLGRSIWEGQADNTINYWSERLGEHLHLGDWLAKGAEKLGASKLSKAINLLGSNKFLEKGGIQDYPSEVFEEEAGIVANSLLIGDNKLSDLYDKKTQADIWGGLALSMGLMKAGTDAVHHGLRAATAAQYYRFKHATDKADNVASYRMQDKWQPLKEQIDDTTNDKMQNVIMDIVDNNNLQPSEKKAAMDYAGNLMKMRGYNMGLMSKAKDEAKTGDTTGSSSSESYSNGYNAEGEDMNNIKNQYESAKQELSNFAADDTIDQLDKDPVGAYKQILQDPSWSEDERKKALDYINAKSSMDGVIQRAQDDLDSRVSQSDDMVDSRVKAPQNGGDGMIHPATLKDERKVYIISGDANMMNDNTMVDPEKSSESIIVRDGDTGKMEEVSPGDILSVDDPLNPDEEKQSAAGLIKQQFSQERASQIDGVLPFDQGDQYNVIGEDLQQHNVTVQQDNGDGTITAIIDNDSQPIILQKDAVQQGSDALKKQIIEQKRDAQNAQLQNTQSAHNLKSGDDVYVQGDDGRPIHGTITGYDEAENRYMVQTDQPVNGNVSQPYDSTQLIMPEQISEKESQVPENGNSDAEDGNNIPEQGNNMPAKDNQAKDIQQSSVIQNKTEQEQPLQQAIDRIPIHEVDDGKGKKYTVHNWEQAKPEDTYDALLEVYQGNQKLTKKKLNNRVANIDKKLKVLQKQQDKLDESDDFDADIASANQYKAIANQKKQLDSQRQYWQNVQSIPLIRQTEQERKNEADHNAIKETADKAAREAEIQARLEKEQTEGVPDVVNDKPADARNRGFRSVNGHIVKRQEKIQGVTGRESSIKFSNDDTVKGHLKVIEADQLQPSHISGQRNPSFFIDEAQPKDRTDKVSSMAAAKIASNINPEEIMGDGSAYQFSAPTINTHGEVIQGNNRSDALKLMYSSSAFVPAQEAYKKYLIDHSDEFGLNKGAIEKMQHPVMVNEVNVSDDDAIRLGQLTAKDNESGGVERIDPVTTSRILGGKVSNFANVLLSNTDDDISLNDLMVENGVKSLKYLHKQGAISDTQYQSAFDNKGNITPEAKLDLQNILKQSLFHGGVSDLHTMFDNIPAKAQKAILSTFMRDFDSAENDRILREIQKAIEVMYEASHSAPEFAKASNYKEAKVAMEGYARQTSLTDQTMPSGRYSNFAMDLACRLQGLTMKSAQKMLSDYFDFVQGKTMGDLFGGSTPGEQLHRVNAIREVFGIEYKPINKKQNGQERSNDVDSDSSQSREGRPRKPANGGRGESIEERKQSANNTGGIKLPSEKDKVNQFVSNVIKEVRNEIQGLPVELVNSDEDLKQYKKIGLAPKYLSMIENDLKDPNIAGTFIPGANMIIFYPSHAAALGIDEKGIKETIYHENVHALAGRISPEEFAETANLIKQEYPDLTNYIEAQYSNRDDVIKNEEYVAEFIGNQLTKFSVPDIIEEKIDFGSNKLNQRIQHIVSLLKDRNYGRKEKENQGDLHEKGRREEQVSQRPLYNSSFGSENRGASQFISDNGDAEKRASSLQRDTHGIEEIENKANVENDYTQKLDKRINVTDDESEEPSDSGTIYKRKIIVDGDQTVIQVDEPDNKGNYSGSYFLWNGNRYGDIPEVISAIDDGHKQRPIGKTDGSERVQAERDNIETKPTDGQKEAGNYKKGHIKVDGYDITIENPKGSTRSGKDSSGKEWSIRMNYDYGYIKGTEGTDGDHIDIYLSDNPTSGNVYVVDQVNQKTGKFDEHKVMYGFPSMEVARDAYASQYEKGWKIGPITEVSRNEFKKWVNSSTRKTKSFSEYKSVNPVSTTQESPSVDDQSKVSPSKIKEPSPNRLVTDARYEELKKRMRAKLDHLNMGIDPEILAIGTEMAVYHIEKGARKFIDYAKDMIADMGDAIRPYLKSFYNGARDLPEMERLAKDMSPYDEVRTFNVAIIGKEGKEVKPSLLDTAEQISNETTVEQHKPSMRQVDIEGLLNNLKTNAKAKLSNHHVDTSVAKENYDSEIESGKEQKKSSRSTKKDVSLKQEQEPGLFDSFFDTNDKKKGKEDGLQRTDESRTEGLPANKSRYEKGTRKEQTGSSEGSREETGRTEQQRRGGRTEPNRFVQSGPERLKNQNNNHVQRGKDYAPHEIDSRIKANIDAIKLMQKLIAEDRKATPEEMSILRKFSGWGGLGKAFKEDNPISQRLRSLLGDDAYDQAVMSRNSAYYTPAPIIDTLWDIAHSLGFKGGNILEGSAGIGNILGLMPKDISDHSNIHAVEIDSTSGNILSLLYPDAKTDVQGFEKTKIPNGSVDLAITNVPFVTGLRVQDTTGDKDLSQKFHDIHDFCIAKNIRKLREGGIGIFITSSGTLDNSQKLRDWIVGDGNADVIGAFRMNNETFGGTSATSDIIVVRKRVNGQKSVHTINVSPVSAERTVKYDTGEFKNGKPVFKQLAMDYNKYFINHPENMGGVMKFGFETGDNFRPTSKGLFSKHDINQKQRLEDWSHRFKDKNSEDVNYNDASTPDEQESKVYESLGSNVKEGSFLVNKDGQLCIATYGHAIPLNDNGKKVRGHSKVDCFNNYTAIKNAVNDVLNYESDQDNDKGLRPLLGKLNKAYDDFVSVYGHFNKNTAISFLKNDIDYSSISALESYREYNDDKGNRQTEYTKSDIFSKRVITKETEPKPTNIKEGIVTSIYKFGRVDLPYLSEQLGESEDKIEHDIIRQGLGFENPVNRQVEVSYEYLSGNVREKLDQAKENNENGQYDANIKALQKVIPMNIPSHLIDFSLGSSWLEPSLYNDYIKEKTGVDIHVQNIGGTWVVPDVYEYGTEKNRSMGVHSEQLNKTVYGHELITAAMQNNTIVVSHTYKDSITGESTTITDKDATQNCATKIDEIRSDFKDWARSKMQQNPELADKYEKIYNDKFNNYVPKTIPDHFVPEFFSGANHKIHLRPHQAKAAVRGTTQNLLLAHEVGTGKTFTLITTAMEMRRLGTANKPMIVVQNATVGQFISSAKLLYPKAKILTLEDGDRNTEGRKAFYAKIKYNDWDMIVIPQSTLERIPDSEERQIAFIKDKIQEKMDVLEQMKDANADNFAIRNANNEVNKLEDELTQLSQSIADKRSKKKERNEKKEAITRQNAEVQAKEMLDRQVDDVENFDEMGIDALLVDEAHEYKHLGFATAMTRGVKGVDPSFSKKSQCVYLKCQSVMEKTGGKNIIFATGTPISNTAAEIWTFMRYLMPADTMKQYDIYYFDDFARNFGNISQHTEFTTSGKYKDNNRFIGYLNLPELVRIWSGVSDTVLTDEASDLKSKIPDIEGGKASDVYLPQTKSLRSVMKFVRSELDRYDKMSGKEKRANSAIPLKMYGIAKAAAIDPRLVMENAEDDPNSKTNAAVKETLKALDKSKNYKGTCAIFADNYQNKQSGFNLYDEIKRKLVAAGVPEKQICIMRSGMSIKKKENIFSKVNAGDIRVIMGSTATLGTGVNIQERLKLLIHLDAPNRPMDYTQRMGRILRQGNLHKQWGIPVKVIRFGVEDSLDVTAYQRLKTKGAIADSIMHGKRLMENSMENRSIEEDDDQFGDTVAQLSGSQYALLKQQAEREVRKLEAKKKQWEADQIYIHHQKPRLKAIIDDDKQRIGRSEKNLQILKDKKSNEGIVIGKHNFKDIAVMADFFKDQNKKLKEIELSLRKASGGQKKTSTLQMKISGLNFIMHTALEKEIEYKEGNLVYVVHHTMTYDCPELGLENVPVRQGYLRNAIDDIKENVLSGTDFNEQKEYAKDDIEHQESELSQVDKREGKPFQFTDDLQAAKDRFEDYNEKMKKELEAKEAKYAKMDKEVNAATGITDSDDLNHTRFREGISFRNGQGFAIHNDYDWRNNSVEYSVDGINAMYPSREQLLDAFRNKYENYVSSITSDGSRIVVEPWSKYLKPKYGKAAVEQKAFIERKTVRAQTAIDQFAHKLNMNNVTVLTSTEDLDGKRANAKGWYDTNTGKIVIVLPNHTSLSDVIRTLLHEGVAHYGLRKLFGKHFSNFLYNVYANANTDVKQRINDLAIKKYHGDFAVATEEYLASLAEDTDFEHADREGWWMKIKNFFLKMLAKAGIKLGSDLTDNDLRYILWRSYKNLEGAPYRSIIDEAEDITMNDRLNTGDFAKTIDTDDQEDVADGEKRYREKDTENDDIVNVVKGLSKEYDEAMKKSRFQAQEAIQDSMLSLKKLMEIIQKHSGKNKIEDWENPYMAENALSSRNKAEADEYNRKYYVPMMDALRNLEKEGISMDQAADYLMAKHGIERNREMALRKAITDGKTGNINLNALQKWNAEKARVKDDRNFRTWEQKQKELDRIATSEFGVNLEDRDYSGLTSLFADDMEKSSQDNQVEQATDIAYKTVVDFMNHYKTQPLEQAVHNATTATLEKLQSSGLISYDTLNNIRNMYDYYIPLRGFNETTADEVYGYVRDERVGFNNPLKKANGRSSKAENPFVHIINMADSAILQGNRNLMKQQFLNFVQNRPSDLVSISDMWIQKSPATGEWETVFPNIPDDATPEEVDNIVQQFNDRLQKMLKEGDPDVKRVRGEINVPYRLLHNEQSEHQVIIKRNGREYILTINGNPRAAMALNGKTNPHGDYSGVGGAFKHSAEYINRQLSAFYTTRNPDFVASNFVRDAFYSNSMVWVKEPLRYAINFHHNFVKFNPIEMSQLFHKWNHGQLNQAKTIEKEFYNFMMHGGETGYSNMADVEKLKKSLMKDLKNGKLHQMKILLDRLDLLNRAVENTARFAAYMTSRTDGRSIAKSVFDAKEISVNFNKKGAGGTFFGKTGQTRIGNLAAGSSAACRALYVFFNAGVQGTTNILRIAKNNKKKFGMLAAAYFILGYVAPLLWGGNDGDDKDSKNYDDLPDYVRRSNLIFPGLKKSYISLPLPIEFRTMYGMGELASQVLHGKEHYTSPELVREMTEQVTQALPIDFIEGEGTGVISPFVPSIAAPIYQAHENMDWTGIPIYNDTEYNKRMPNWTKAFSRTNRHLIDLTKKINAFSGGDEFTKGKIDLNPAIVESLVEGYFGGAVTFINKMSNSIDMATGKMPFDWRNVPIGNRLIKSGNELTKQKAINREYFDNIDKLEELNQRENGYKKKVTIAGTDPIEKAEYETKLMDLYNSNDYKDMQAFKYINKEIKKLTDIQKQGVDDKDIDHDIWYLKNQANELLRKGNNVSK